MTPVWGGRAPGGLMSAQRLRIMRTAAEQLPTRYGVVALLLTEAAEHIEALQAQLAEARRVS